MLRWAIWKSALVGHGIEIWVVFRRILFKHWDMVCISQDALLNCYFLHPSSNLVWSCFPRLLTDLVRCIACHSTLIRQHYKSYKCILWISWLYRFAYIQCRQPYSTHTKQRLLELRFLATVQVLLVSLLRFPRNFYKNGYFWESFSWHLMNSLDVCQCAC